MKAGLIGPITAHLLAVAYSQQQLVQTEEIESIPDEFLPVLAPLPEIEELVVPEPVEEQENVLEDLLEHQEQDSESLISGSEISVNAAGNRSSDFTDGTEETSEGTSEDSSEGTSEDSSEGTSEDSSAAEYISDIEFEQRIEEMRERRHRRHKRAHKGNRRAHKGHKKGGKRERKHRGKDRQHKRERNHEGRPISLRQSHGEDPDP